MKLQKISDSEFWLESPEASVVAKFIIDSDEILYDVFSPEYDVHLNEEAIKDVEALDFFAEAQKDWKLEESVEDLWLILDQVKFWAEKNKLKKIKQTELI